jgi:hypothetical protein
MLVDVDVYGIICSMFAESIDMSHEGMESNSLEIIQLFWEETEGESERHKLVRAWLMLAWCWI